MEQYPRPYGRYTLLERIGVGGMSSVDLAKRAVDDAAFVRFCVIKRVTPANLSDGSFLRMFQDEARITAELHHENIAQVYDFGKHQDELEPRVEYFLVMEYVPGMDLRVVQRLAAERGRLLPLRITLSVLCEVLKALQYSHTHSDSLGNPMRIVHRDINPRNVMLSVRGEVKVIDFGIALAADRLEKTQGQSLKGKFAYMSPEQIEATVELDGRTDIYAVGLMLHELISGRSPFDGLTELQIMHRILTGQVPPPMIPSDYPYPAYLQGILARAVALNRDARYLDAETFRQDLQSAADPLGGLASQEERAAFLREIDPERILGIQSRLRAYRENTGVSQVSPLFPPPPGAVALSSNAANRTVAFPVPDTSLDAETEEQPMPRKRTRWLLPLVVLLLLGFLSLVTVVIGVGFLWTKSESVELLPDPASRRTEETIAASLGMSPEEMKANPPQPPIEPTSAESHPQAPLLESPPGASTQGLRQAATHALPSAPHSPPSETTASSSSLQGSDGVEVSSASTTTSAVAPASESVASPLPSQQKPENPTPPPQDTEAQGWLKIASRPAGLEILLDGKSIGRTPQSLKVSAGDHLVVVRDSSGRQQSRSVNVKAKLVVPVILTFSTGSGSDETQKR